MVIEKFQEPPQPLPQKGAPTPTTPAAEKTGDATPTAPTTNRSSRFAKALERRAQLQENERKGKN